MKRKSPNGSAYPKDWDKIAKAVKDAAGWKCVRCGREHNPADGYTLTVHHLDINPSNCAWWNIPALCQRCHLSIQSRVVMERPYMFDHSEWFKPYVAAYYMACSGRYQISMDYWESVDLLPRVYVEMFQDEVLQERNVNDETVSSLVLRQNG